MGLTLQDADASSATSLDETDILKIISTISMVGGPFLVRGY